MTRLKRGIFGNKRGQTEHESMWTLSELVFFSIFVISLLLFSYSVWKNTTYQKNFLARDMALTIDTLYISPQRITLTYPHNVSQFNLLYSGNLVRIGEEDILNKQTDRTYWFVDEEGRKLDYMKQRIIQPNVIIYTILPENPLIILNDDREEPVSPETG